MKGGGGGAGKRRWKGLVIGVLVLVFLSMLVPLTLLGLHNGFHSPGFAVVQSTSASNGVPRHESFSRTNVSGHSKNGQRNMGIGDRNESTSKDATRRGLPLPPNAATSYSPPNMRDGAINKGIQNTTENTDETGKTCEVKYGSYCHWREENKEQMQDSKVKKMKDQLFVARAYYPSIAKMPSQDKLTRGLKQSIQEFERVLSENSVDADLPTQIDKKLRKMEAVISEAKLFLVDCGNVDKKLRQILDMTEDEAGFHMKQSAFLYQLAVQTMPKSLHCLSMRLTGEYFKLPPFEQEHSIVEKFTDPSLHHYVIISNNVVASLVVINSTVLHASESNNVVFHVLTDEQNYFGMKLWFFRNTYRQASVRVLSIERLDLDNYDKSGLLHLSLPVEFRISFHDGDNWVAIHNKAHHLSVFSYSHYLLPKIFHNLGKIVILDDDVVVQRDLSPLWDIDMEGKANGAVRSCSVRLGQLKSHIKMGSLDVNSCSWMSGLNIVDLDKWRELDLSETFQRLVKELMSAGDLSREAVALQASLLTFQDLVYPLDVSWAQSGLGYDYGVHEQSIKRSAILHYNGNMKPWLELGIPKYKMYWRRFLNWDDEFLSKCNLNP